MRASISSVAQVDKDFSCKLTPDKPQGEAIEEDLVVAEDGLLGETMEEAKGGEGVQVIGEGFEDPTVGEGLDRRVFLRSWPSEEVGDGESLGT
ncbi:hypothetical protein QJS10_CPA10g00131 [Acorus calamus]|uniref:Uncharacterized protein n=1 Tax=Acorus calamus TaxID=4465 RepID=A0AAV9E1M9_ACOCL|nr:hypothetical protein QJS10_CPA10g00131 [Acorus calamus]